MLANEMITTGANAVMQVELEGGTMLDLGRDSRIALDAELLSEGGGAPAAAQDVATLQAAIAAGADPSQVAAATAAGAPGAGGSDSGGGHSFVVLEQANSAGEVTSGFPTQPAGIAFPTQDLETLPEVEEAVQPENIPPVVSAAAARVSEEGLLKDGVPVGIPDTAGNLDTTDAIVVSGAIPMSDVDGNGLTVTLTAPTTPLYSNGVAIAWSGSGTGTLTGSAGGVPVTTISVGSDGAYAVRLLGPVDDVDAAAEDETSFDVGVTVFDGAASATAAFTVTIEDDGPSVSVAGVLPVLTVDESILATDDSADFSGVFTSSFGADGAGGVSYALRITGGNGTASGFVDSMSGKAIVLVLNGNVVEGHVGTTSGVLAFTIMLDAATGHVTLDQLRAVMHDSADSPVDISEPASFDANILILAATVTDADGDSHGVAIDLGSNISFLDDGPSLIVPEAGYVGNQVYATFTGALDFDSNVDDNAGADQGAVVKFGAAQDGTDSGLTSGGSAVYLYVSDDGKVLTGSTATTEAGFSGENTVFAVAINQDGSLGAANDPYTVTMFSTIDNGAGIEFTDLSGTGPAGNPAWKVVESGVSGLDILFTPINAGSINSDVDDVGVGSQFIDFDTGMRIDFADFEVTGPKNNPDYSFGPGGHYTVNNFLFSINQIAGGTFADLLLKVYDADEDDPSQSDFDDPQKAITEVRVYDTAQNLVVSATGDGTVGGLDFDFDADGAGGVTVRGLLEGYRVVTGTADGYDRIEITNAGTGGDDGKFSISNLEMLSVDTGEPVDARFAIALYDADGDSVPGSIGLTFEPSALDGSQTVTGDASDNTLFGGGGDDEPSGMGGNDVLVGGSGDDSISGGDGDDVIVGGAGSDALTGGSGSDTFVYNNISDAADTISDFTVGVGPNADVLDVNAMLRSTFPQAMEASHLEG